MAVIDDDDPRLQSALHSLTLYLMRYNGSPLTTMTLNSIKDDVEQWRIHFKTNHGYDIPPIAPLILPSIGYIVFYRTDLEDREIHSKLLFLLRDFSRANITVDTTEFASATLICWPHYKAEIETLRKTATKTKFIN